ncbi:hypothetical protein [Arthrobacter sp. RIT-PI-e]|uniref:hypothetical protein n=1 Tax=Arthrobacter sp. RIT-PI-e TaxID=1681197 RepID=UPI000676770C|nr:hypothetical protein [Arthrobacter sp. RIT-PI-e]
MPSRSWGRDVLQVALAQVRTNARRFVAVGLAVILGVSFLSAPLMAGSTTTASLTRSVGASSAAADLVVTNQYGWVPPGVGGDLGGGEGGGSVHGFERGYTRWSPARGPPARCCPRRLPPPWRPPT